MKCWIPKDKAVDDGGKWVVCRRYSDVYAMKRISANAWGMTKKPRRRVTKAFTDTIVLLQQKDPAGVSINFNDCQPVQEF